MLTLGVDVGGSKLLACLVDDAGTVVAEERHETGRATSPRHIVQRVTELVWRFRADGRAPAAIGRDSRIRRHSWSLATRRTIRSLTPFSDTNHAPASYLDRS